MWKEKMVIENKEIFDDQEFYALRDYIYDICGIYFRLEKKYLIEDKVINRMNELSINNVSDYIYYLKYNPEKEKELSLLYDYITINETSFFRNKPQMQAFEEEVLPEMIKNIQQDGRKSIRIWSAGCSSGEEPYTISIILKDRLMLDGSWYTDITATDINDTVLGKAKAGIYTDYPLRNTDEKMVQRCFTKISDKEFKIEDRYKSGIRFRKLNLLDDDMISSLPLFDIIFCRNVLIYFDLNSKIRVLDKFYEMLKPGGYLFLGHSESLHGISAAFKLILFKGALAYKKQ